MEGLRISFEKSNVALAVTGSSTGFDCTIQNALTNIGTRKGTDHMYSNKGTDILLRAVQGKIVGMNDANHEAQIAAIDTLFFSRDYETSASGTIVLGAVTMQPLTYDGNALITTTSFTDLDQTRTVGTATIL
jgi:hypothetical protein